MDLTVEEYLSFTANLRWVPAAEVSRAVKAVMGRCDITHFRKRLIRNLSGGYQQRIGIAQAIIHNPKFVVLDEPTNVGPKPDRGDPAFVQKIAEERTVILSTHILSEVQVTCDYIRMIEQGKLVFAGTVNEFDNYIVPNTLFVSLAAAPPVGELAAIPGVSRVEELGGSDYRVHFTDKRDVTNRIVQTSVARVGN